MKRKALYFLYVLTVFLWRDSGLAADVTASPAVEAVPAPVAAPVYYRGMLGSYGKDYPFYILSVPDGSNVWGDAITKKLNGKFDVTKPPQQFTASGKFYLPKKLTVIVEAGRAVSVTIDKLGYDLSNYGKTNSTAVELDTGVHSIKLDVGNNGGQMSECSIKITDTTGTFVCPIFITEGDIADLVKTLPKGATELSGWDQKSTKIDLKIPQ